MDIVLPVYRALRHVRTCLTAIERWTADVPYRLTVVDDDSGDNSSQELARLVEPFGVRAQLLTNETNQGFLPTVNRGMRAGDAAVVVILNTDTFVTPGWLLGLLACLDSAPDVGVASPVSNYANLTRIRGHYGVHHLAMAAMVRTVSPRHYPEVRFATGACMAVRRPLLEELDFFDERYGRGYFEESDLCLRAAERGWRTVADDATYVHHHGWGSFGASQTSSLMQHNARLFDDRWGQDAHRRIRRAVRRARPFEELERRIAVSLARSAQVRPRRSLPAPGRRMLAQKAMKGDRIDRPPQLPPTWWSRPFAQWQRIAAEQAAPPDDAADLLIVVDDLAVNPWSTDVLRIADRLLDDGLDVSVATTGTFDPAVLADPSRVWPYILSGPDELMDVVRPHRIVLATSPATVYDSLLLRERDGSQVVGWLQPDALSSRPLWSGDAPALAAAAGLVMAQLHAGGIFATGAPTHHVPIGVDLDVYRDVTPSGGPASVLLVHGAAVAPSYGHDALEIVRQLDRQGIDVTVYGDPVPGAEEVRTVRLAPQEREAALLAEHQVVVEVAPIPGLDRFRLRSAAAGVPSILASPVGDACPLRVGEDVYGVPRGDTARLARLTVEVVTGANDPDARSAAARERVQDLTLEAESRALLAALKRLQLVE